MPVKSDLKELIARVLRRGTSLLVGTRVGRIVADQAVVEAIGDVVTVDHHGLEMRFAATNWINRFRAETFSSKEPETLEWIDGMPPGSVLWDIGANVGLYSCYAAAARGCRVVSFEPSLFNLEMLARNVYLNGWWSSLSAAALSRISRIRPAQASSSRVTNPPISVFTGLE